MNDKEVRNIINSLNDSLENLHVGFVDGVGDVYAVSEETIRNVIALLKEHEAIKPTINEYGEAYCICGENVGIIPNSKNLPKILSKYCSECGRRMKWNG